VTASRRIHFSTREQLLSPDFNRLQTLLAGDRDSLLRALYNDQRWGFHRAPGFSSIRGAVETPIAADVFAGLMVRPDNATSLTIDPGVVAFWRGTGAGPLGAEDSPYALCVSPGLPTLGVLTFTANAGGGTRLDVIECRPLDTVTESGNRNIFDTSTGLFAPALVDKVKSTTLEFRIRVGTSGGGFPGVVSGWLPLAVCCVQVGASNFSQCDFWDVRPLVDERMPRTDPFTTEDFLDQEARIDRCEYSVMEGTGANRFLQGYSDATFNGYFAGGDLLRSSASSLAAFGSSAGPDGGESLLHVNSVQNQADGFTFPGAKSVYYIAALFPHGLPRWVRYGQVVNPAFGVRTPRGPRGILTVTRQTPFAGGYYDGVPAPAMCGFTGGHRGVALGIQSIETAAFRPGIANGRWHYNGHQVPSDLNLAPSAQTTASLTFTLPDGVIVPVAASEIIVSISALTVTAASDQPMAISAHLMDAASSTITVAALMQTSHWVYSSGNSVQTPMFVVPLRSRNGHLANSRSSIRLQALFNSATGLGTSFMSVHGWKLG